MITEKAGSKSALLGGMRWGVVMALAAPVGRYTADAVPVGRYTAESELGPMTLIWGVGNSLEHDHQ